MTSLVIAWEYLTGYSVATDPADRERAEWIEVDGCSPRRAEPDAAQHEVRRAIRDEIDAVARLDQERIVSAPRAQLDVVACRLIADGPAQGLASSREYGQLRADDRPVTDAPR